MQGRWPFLVALSLTLVGCLGGAPPPADEPGAAAPPTVFPFSMRGCEAVIGVVSVPQATVAPHLPEGWRSLSVQELGLANAPNPRGDGNVGLELFTCDEIDGLDGPVADATYGSLWSAVEPPAEFRREVAFHFVKWDVTVADPVARGHLAAAGVPASSATGSFSEFTLLPGGGSRYAGKIDWEAGWSVTFAGASAAPAPDAERASGVEYTATPAGFAVWTASWAWTPLAIGPVTVQVQGAGLAADLLGTERHQGAAFSGVVEFLPESNVTLPARDAS